MNSPFCCFHFPLYSVEKLIELKQYYLPRTFAGIFGSSLLGVETGSILKILVQMLECPLPAPFQS